MIFFIGAFFFQRFNNVFVVIVDYRFQKKLNKREKLEGKSKMSHSVHCPYFPEDKQEYWWTYICDRKSKTLLTAPYHCTNLVGFEEIQLKFTAPRWPGIYTFTVCLRSGMFRIPKQHCKFFNNVVYSCFFPLFFRFLHWNGSTTRSQVGCKRGGGNSNRTPTMGN